VQRRNQLFNEGEPMMNTELEKTVQWVLDSFNLEDLKNRLDHCFDFEPNYMPILVPTFGGSVPNEDGVKVVEQHNCQRTFVGNRYMEGYTGHCQFGVVSWDEDRLLVFDEQEMVHYIVIRSEFCWFGGSNDNFKREVIQ